MVPRTVATASDGAFLVPQLPIGVYTVTTTVKGFKTDVQSGINITAGFTANIKPVMQVGASTQQVEVTGVAPAIDVASETLATTFDSNLLQNLPSGRDPWSTLEEAPGVASSTFDVGGNNTFYQSTLYIHGSLGQAVYSYDGLNLSWPGGNGTATSFYNDQDALAELQTVTDSAPADVSVGGVYMNFVTKSGSNTVHGGASINYETAGMESTLKEPVFDDCTSAGTPGTNCFTAPIAAGAPIIMERDTEVNLGGPLIKDKLWLFGAWRLLDTSEAQDQLACNPNPAEGVSCPGGYNPAPSYPNHQSDVTLRTDYQLNNSNRLFFSWWWNEQNQFKRISLAYTQPDAAQLQIEPAYNLVWGWDYTITPNLVLNSRLGYQHLIFPLTYEPGVTPTSVAFEDTVTGSLENAALTSQVEPATEWRGSQEASYFLGNFYGSHNIRLGWEDSTNRNGIDSQVNENVRAIFQSGAPTSIQVVDGPTDEYSLFHEGGAFVQDAWRVSGRLTLNIGGRWDHWDGWIPQDTNPTVAPGPGGVNLANAFANGGGAGNTQCVAGTALSSCQFPGFSNRSVAFTRIADWNNLSPRLGLAYDLTGHGTSVIDASFSSYVIAEGTGTAESINPNNLAGFTYNWSTSTGVPATCTYSTPTGCTAYLGPQYWGTQTAVIGAITTTLDPNIKRPFSNEIQAGWQKAFDKNLVFAVDYFHRNNRDQIGRYNLLIPPSAYTPVTTVNPLTNQPLTVYAVTNGEAGKSDYFVTNAGAADDNAYNGVQFTGTKHMSSNWQLLAGLTIQRYRGNYTAGTGDDFNDPNLNINRANAYLSDDSTYVFKLNATYNERHTGIEPSMSYQYYTGYPLRPTASFGSNQGGLCSAGTTAPCDPLVSGQSETIALVPPGTYRLPNVSLLDLRFARPTHISERFLAEPTLDLFNITNNQTITAESATVPQPSHSTPNPPTTTFLKPSGLLNPFIARIGMKVTF